MESQPQNPEFRINPENFHHANGHYAFQKANSNCTDQTAWMCRLHCAFVTVQFSHLEAHMDQDIA